MRAVRGLHYIDDRLLSVIMLYYRALLIVLYWFHIKTHWYKKVYRSTFAICVARLNLTRTLVIPWVLVPKTVGSSTWLLAKTSLAVFKGQAPQVDLTHVCADSIVMLFERWNFKLRESIPPVLVVCSFEWWPCEWNVRRSKYTRQTISATRGDCGKTSRNSWGSVKT